MPPVTYVTVLYPPDAPTVERFAYALWASQLPFATAQWTGESEVIRERFRQTARFVLAHALNDASHDD